MDKMALIQRGSQTARDGFKNEHDVAERFNQWEMTVKPKRGYGLWGTSLNKSPA